jgi:hypothetical protein
MESNPTCAICLDDLDCQDVSLVCGHTFHASCLLMCLLRVPAVQWQCPLCRDKILKRSGRHEMCSVITSAEKRGAGASKWQSMHSFLKCVCLALKNRGHSDAEENTNNGWSTAGGQRDIRLPFWGTSRCLNFLFSRGPESIDDVCTTMCARNYILYLLNMRKYKVSVLIMRHIVALCSSVSVFFCGIFIVQCSTKLCGQVVCPLAKKIVISFFGRQILSDFEAYNNMSRMYQIDFALHTHVYCGDTDTGVLFPAACFICIGCMLMIQIKRLFNISSYELLHNWTLYHWKANIFWLGFAILYSSASFLFRTVFTMRFIMRLLGTCISLPLGGRDICFNT